MLDCDHKERCTSIWRPSTKLASPGAAIRYTATARRPSKTGSPKTILSNQGATSTSGHETGLRPCKSDIVFGHEQNTHCTLFRRAPVPAVHLDRFIQYRSKTGIPWSRAIAPNVTANVGPVNLNWMQTGSQADFWPSQLINGQVYSENTPMGIMAYRGQVVKGAGMGSRRLMGSVGDLKDLGKAIKANEWNQYTVIARGQGL